jgi:hypothetical protein
LLYTIPSGHGVHEVAPLVDAKVLVAHGVHDDVLSISDEYFPAAHAVHVHDAFYYLSYNSSMEIRRTNTKLAIGYGGSNTYRNNSLNDGTRRAAKSIPTNLEAYIGCITIMRIYSLISCHVS